MSELELQRELFRQLDEDIRELLSLVHSIRISKMVHNDDKAREDLIKARWLAQRIEEALGELG